MAVSGESTSPEDRPVPAGSGGSRRGRHRHPDRPSRRRVPAWSAALAVTTLLLAGVAAWQDGPALAAFRNAPAPGTRAAAAAASIPTASRFAGVSPVGVLFPSGTATQHTCVGAVIRASSGPDLVLTAAHCLTGNGQKAVFVPGYHQGKAPYGTWRVAGAYADPRWLSSQDQQHDYAFLVLAPNQSNGKTVRLRARVPGYVLGSTPVPPREVRVIAYGMGSNDNPITCIAPTYRHAGFPAFDCHGYVDGSSGSPWINSVRGQVPVVHAVIGGLNHGGCYEYTSYSSTFTQDIVTLYHRALAAGPADTLPRPHGDGC